MVFRLGFGAMRMMLPLLFGTVVGVLIGLVFFPALRSILMSGRICVEMGNHDIVEAEVDPDWLDGKRKDAGEGQELDDPQGAPDSVPLLDNNREEPAGMLHDEGELVAEAAPYDYEPRYVTPLQSANGLPTPANGGDYRLNGRGKRPKVLRPRFLATELGIKDKLFVGIVTTRQTLSTLALALNRTVAHHVSKLVFFVEGAEPVELTGPLNLVGFSDPQLHLKPLYALEYIKKHVVNNYDWFFLVPDSAYLKAFKLFELVTHMSVGYDVMLGRSFQPNSKGASGSAGDLGAPNLGRFCDLDAGILWSRGALMRLSNGYKECIDEGKPFRSWHLEADFATDGDIMDFGSRDASFNSSLVVFPVTDLASHYRLHKYFVQLEIGSVTSQLGGVKEEIKNMSTLFPNDVSWPYGVRPPWRPKNRWEVQAWNYFTETDIFPGASKKNRRELAGVERDAMKAVLKLAREKVSAKYAGTNIRWQRLQSGYSRFDPTRGMEYILDVIFEADGSQRPLPSLKRLRVMRPLNRVEIISMPYVTEATRISIILPVRATDVVAALIFLDMYDRVCLDGRENVALSVAIIFSAGIAGSGRATAFAPLIGSLKRIRRKVGGTPGSYLNQIILHDSPAEPLTSMDVVDRILEQVHEVRHRSGLFMLLSPYTVELTSDFLNRVRMNSIAQRQVYFPIPFVQFDPELVTAAAAAAGSPRPRSLASSGGFDVHKDSGRFDAKNYETASFYAVDYGKQREDSISSGGGRPEGPEGELASMFLAASNLHVMRATEPSLKLRHRKLLCNPDVGEEGYGECLVHAREGLASKAQLAALVFQRLLSDAL